MLFDKRLAQSVWFLLAFGSVRLILISVWLSSFDFDKRLGSPFDYDKHLVSPFDLIAFCKLSRLFAELAGGNAFLGFEAGDEVTCGGEAAGEGYLGYAFFTWEQELFGFADAQEGDIVVEASSHRFCLCDLWGIFIEKCESGGSLLKKVIYT